MHDAAPARPYRPALSALGLHRCAAVMFAILIVTAAGTMAAFRITSLHYAWRESLPVIFVTASLVCVWAYYVWMPGRRDSDWIVAETFLLLAFVLTFCQILGPGQYAAAALGRPYIDASLAAADAALGVHVPSLVVWTKAHPVISLWMARAYSTLIPQMFLPVFVLGFWYRDRRSLWEYAFHFHVAAAVTLICFALWPAACAFTFYGFESTFEQSRVIEHLRDVRTGMLTTIIPTKIEGLVSFPSFHTAGALMTTWAFRRYRVWCAGLIVVNVGLISATVFSGAHYVVDLLGTLIMCLGSLTVYRAARLDPSAARARSAREHESTLVPGLAVAP